MSHSEKISGDTKNFLVRLPVQQLNIVLFNVNMQYDLYYELYFTPKYKKIEFIKQKLNIVKLARASFFHQYWILPRKYV